MSKSSPFLRSVLLFDAAACVAMGALLTLGSTVLAGLTALPPALLFYAGASLLPIATIMAFVATRPTLQAGLVRLIVAGNIAWVAASILLPVSGWVEPNVIGAAFIVGQAVAVAVLAWLEHTALGKMPLAVAASYAPDPAPRC